MRKTNPVDALLPATRRELLRLTYGQPERWWYLSELASEIGTSPSSLQREVESLTAAAFLQKRVEGRRTYYRAEKDNAIFHELSAIVAKTMGVGEQLRTALKRLQRKIDVAFIYGSFARGEQRGTSDIDLFVIGKAGLSEIAPIATRLERRLGRPLNPTVMTATEFRRRRSENDHFVTTILREKKEFLIGDEDALAAVAR
ncbi:MAG TPA: nucleotidyltransferase domain-containing protein [Thermoanaerobaculia bacterium]